MRDQEIEKKIEKKEKKGYKPLSHALHESTYGITRRFSLESRYQSRFQIHPRAESS
jgi:hypothetical protein